MKTTTDFNINIEDVKDEDIYEYDLLKNFLSNGKFYIFENENYKDSDWSIMDLDHYKYTVFFLSVDLDDDITCLYSLYYFDNLPNNLDEEMTGIYGYYGDMNIDELTKYLSEYLGLKRGNKLSLDEIMEL